MFLTRKYWRLAAVVVGAIIVLILLIVAFRSCGGKKEIKIDEAALQKVNSVNRIEREQELKEIITENLEVIKTIDNRTVLTDVVIEQRNREIAAKVKEADAKITEAKQQGKDVSSAELQCLLIPEDCEKK